MRLTKDDKLWADLVKDREAWTCQRCAARHAVGSRGMNAHHVFTRSRRNTRHMLSNGVALCVGCHRWVHANPWDAEPFLRRIVPDFDDLQQQSRTLKKRQAIT